MHAVCLVFTTFASHFFYIIFCSLISNLLLCLDLLFFLPLALRAASACDYFFFSLLTIWVCVCVCVFVILLSADADLTPEKPHI